MTTKLPAEPRKYQQHKKKTLSSWWSSFVEILDSTKRWKSSFLSCIWELGWTEEATSCPLGVHMTFFYGWFTRRGSENSHLEGQAVFETCGWNTCLRKTTSKEAMMLGQKTLQSEFGSEITVILLPLDMDSSTLIITAAGSLYLARQLLRM